MQMINVRCILFVLFPLLSGSYSFTGGKACPENEKPALLVFTKTEGYQHASIPDGVEAVRKLGERHHFRVDHTEDASAFEKENLQQYDAVVFLSTSGDVFDDNQQAAFKQYIRSGGGFVGIHAATTTEYDWPWYGKLAGAYFDDHPHVQEAVVEVVEKNHPSTVRLPERWARTDEWYNYYSVSPDINVLLRLDEDTYEGGRHGEHHPIAWYQEFESGRAFYTGGGHTPESFSEPMFLEHILGGIRYVLCGGSEMTGIDQGG